MNEMFFGTIIRVRPIPEYFICKRFKKQYVSLYNQDRKLYFFPNTDPETVDVPIDFRICSDVDDFRIKTVKGGFQRRPELISNRDAFHYSASSSDRNASAKRPKICRKTERTKRIQQEMVEMALKLSKIIRIKNINKSTSDMSNRSSVVNVEYDLNNKSSLVLDIGCGDGYSTVPLTDFGLTCVGVDLDFLSLSEYKMDCLEGKVQLKTSDKRFESVKLKSTERRNELKFCVTDCRRCSTVNLPDKNNVSNRQRSDCPSQDLITVQKIFPAADVVRWDLRHGLPFKANTFDMAISISFLQWLFYGKRHRQLDLFFSSLHEVLCPNSKAVIQFYPRNANQLRDAVESAAKYFRGTLVGDYPHIDRGRKLFIILFS